VIEERDIEFARTLWARPALFTKIILGLNIFIFLVMELAGGTTNGATLLAFGVKSNPHIDQGEVWRFVTPIFIHIGLLHLFFNSYALRMVGAQVEKLYGTARLLTL
jgi:rhomboid protease GluP